MKNILPASYSMNTSEIICLKIRNKTRVSTFTTLIQ